MLIVSVYAGSEFLQAQVNEVRPTGQEIRVVLQRVALLSGSVVDPSGTMIPDLGIEAVSASGKRHQGICDAQGEFALPVAGGQNYILRLTGKSRTDLGNASRRGPVMLPIANDPSRWRGEIIGIAAPSSSIVLRAVEIDAHGAIDVRVEDPDGRPVEGARVLMTVGSSPTMLETNAHGLARFEKLTDEEVRFRASPPAAKSKLLSYSVMVTARPGKETVVLKLRVLEKLAGSVIDPDGLPAKDVFLTLYVDDVPTAGAESDAEGNFTFDAPRGTKYHITAQRQKAGEAALQGESAPFATGSTPISIVLRR